MKKIDIKTLLTIIAMVVSVTVSHMNLKGRIAVLETTEKLHHETVMDELNEIKMAQMGVPFDNLADEEKQAKKKKKRYAGGLGEITYDIEEN